MGGGRGEDIGARYRSCPPEKDMVHGSGALPAVSGCVVRGRVRREGWPRPLETPLGATRWGKWPAGVGDGHVEVTTYQLKRRT